MPPTQHPHSKQLFTGRLYDARVKASDNVLINNLFDLLFPVLHKIELGHYFCPEFVGHVTSQNISVDAERLGKQTQ